MRTQIYHSRLRVDNRSKRVILTLVERHDCPLPLSEKSVRRNLALLRTGSPSAPSESVPGRYAPAADRSGELPGRSPPQGPIRRPGGSIPRAPAGGGSAGKAVRGGCTADSEGTALCLPAPQDRQRLRRRHRIGRMGPDIIAVIDTVLVKAYTGQEETLRLLLEVKRADNLAQAEAYRDRQTLIRQWEELLELVLAGGACFSLGQLAVKPLAAVIHPQPVQNRLGQRDAPPPVSIKVSMTLPVQSAGAYRPGTDSDGADGDPVRRICGAGAVGLSGCAGGTDPLPVSG